MTPHSVSVAYRLRNNPSILTILALHQVENALHLTSQYDSSFIHDEHVPTQSAVGCFTFHEPGDRHAVAEASLVQIFNTLRVGANTSTSYTHDSIRDEPSAELISCSFSGRVSRTSKETLYILVREDDVIFLGDISEGLPARSSLFLRK